jgi:TRAP-type C4-dicarboxylate transport system permease small subunit
MTPPASPVSGEKARGAAGGLLNVADITDRGIAAVCRFIILAVTLALLVMLTANVVARYALASGGFHFAQEVPERLFPWLIMAGVALGVQKGGHMAVDALLGVLRRQSARIMLLVGHVIVIASYIVLFREALGVADIVSIEKSPVLGISSSYSYYALAGGCIGVILSTITSAIRVAIIGPESLPTPSPEETGT